MSLADWRGKVALVTGATSGIGRAIAEALVADGLRVVACGRRRDRLDDLAAASKGKAGFLLPVVADLLDPASIDALFATVRAEWGGVDLLINNAGVGRNAPLASGATDAWREMLDLNVLAVAICTREAIADMRGRGDSGLIVHISSMSGHRVPGAGGGMYAATKYAVRALTEGLRKELRAMGSGIRVTSISPGTVRTEFAEQFHGSAEAAAQTYGRFVVLEAEDIARCVRHLLQQPPRVEIHDVLLRPTQQTT